MIPNDNHFILDKEIVESSTAWGDGYGFRRSLTGEFESVSYLPGSTIRVWLNKEYVNYDIHWHPEIEMVIPVENGYTVRANEKIYELNAGDILIIPSGTLHELIAPVEGKRIIMLFDINMLSKISGFSYFLSFFSTPVIINKSNCPTIYHDAKDIINNLCHDYFDNDMLRDILFYSDILKLFSSYARYMTQTQAHHNVLSDGNPRSKEIMLKLNVVYDYINEHISEELALETVADVIGFSKFHFSRLFKKYSGYNYYDYLSLQRIKAAESALSNSNMSITEIALFAGFESLSTFNRTFKKIKGCTPSQYRKLIR